ncbi:hypothetical protein Echvi_0551 [Echinicola vietnamensis DSM 17526]|uniref:Uncharacterized protein n=1 Tax=Echinicola vietnamensis (strain DSM 17526 / LMG 23754 / KMM 6221) TaxID=926556 RepID=L0FVY3_ECHVK|nr:hypothetical protein Echvi_0551 [Echinicola vietnamensis DSM 17526]
MLVLSFDDRKFLFFGPSTGFGDTYHLVDLIVQKKV